MKYLKRVVSVLLIAAVLFTSLPGRPFEVLAAEVNPDRTAPPKEEEEAPFDLPQEGDETDREKEPDRFPEEEQPETIPEADQESTEDGVQEEESTKAAQEPLQTSVYENYFYGDPFFSGNFIYGYDEDGNELRELYSDDIEEIIQMAEEGMDLSGFFASTIFEAFSIDTLKRMEAEGISLDQAAHRFLNGDSLPSWLKKAFGKDDIRMHALFSSKALSARDGGPSALTASGVTQMSVSSLGVIPSLGGTASHGPVYRLKAKGDDGNTYSAFCAKYGGSYRTGYTYSAVGYSDLGLSNYQYNLIRTVVNTYYKATGQQDRDFAAAQIIIWYILNNMPDDSKYFDPDYAWTNGGMKEAAVKIGGEDYAEFIRLTILSYSNYINQWWDAGHNDSALSSVVFSPDYYPGVLAQLHFWRCGESNAQYIITWDIVPGDTPAEISLEIPYIDNFYLEKKASAKYKISLTKESVITNELLEGFQFHVVESEGTGYALDYDIVQGTLSEYGRDYPDATTSTFGQTTRVLDPVPYMDDDIKPSNGKHETMLTTDENGFAGTTFVHEHTFREFYSECKDGNSQTIDHDAYLAMWSAALATAENAEATESGNTIAVLYKGNTAEMTYDEIKAIYDAQQVVYTQTKEEAKHTVDTQYAAYMARTYTYTVTELDTYTRPSATDSNGKELPKLSLPKDGYRKDVEDTTTIGSYVEEVKSGGTMTVGGKNDQDPNSQEKNVTNEPWQNQIFIHKTDLETGSQILYDAEFEIFEYYQYKVTMQAALKKIDVVDMVKKFEREQGIMLDADTISEAGLKVVNENGTGYLDQALDTGKLKEALVEDGAYEVSFTPTFAGEYTSTLSLTLDSSLSTNNLITDVIRDGRLTDITDSGSADYPRTYMLQKQTHKVLALTKGADTGVWNVEGGGTVRMGNETGSSEITGPMIYIYTDKEGEVHELSSDQDKANIDMMVDIKGQSVSYYFSYMAYEDTGYRFLTKDGAAYTVSDTQGQKYPFYSIEETTYTISRHAGNYPADGVYEVTEPFSVSAGDLSEKTIDRNVGTDINDYTTWGQENYEIVRVTAGIAKKMGWSDGTIGMYTVHRKSATDAYCGTTFTSITDHATGETFGYQEYGTLYYTQANLGLFAIVEKSAPADSSRTGYLGNFDDRNYDYLDKDGSPSKDRQSSGIEQKNAEGNPYTTKDSMSVVKYVHMIDLCTDTNQYGTYMLVDGYTKYDSVYYSDYVEYLDDAGHTPTEDGYDALYYDQSSLAETISLERFALDDPIGDVLNTYWDEWFSRYLTEKSGISVHRDSAKTDAWFSLVKVQNMLHHYIGTTINTDSFDDNDAAQSDITYDGTYTDTHLNYHSYAGDLSGALNIRDGFNGTEYLQAGTIVYDGGAEEKKARYGHTEKEVTKDPGYAFIDEREYGYIRFSKYDMDAGRYVDGDLKDGYPSGTDHADADLDGAVYSLYVDESNLFDVSYEEGVLENRLFWAMQLKDGGYRLIWDGDGDAGNGFTDLGTNEYQDYPHACVIDGRLYLDYYDETAGETEVSEKTAVYHGIQHPDGQYGGEKHNGFYAVFEEQQVFIDTDANGYADTWTLQDVTLYAGAKAASAPIRDGELSMDGLYLGTYYLAEEIRDAITIFSTDNDDVEKSENRWLSFAPGYTADTDENGNPVKYLFRFPYVGQEQDTNAYDAEQDYVHKDTGQVSRQKVVKGGSAQFTKITTNGESASSGNTAGEALEGAGFTVFLLSELKPVKDGSIVPVYTEEEGHKLVEDNHLVKLFDAAGNMVGYQFTKKYMEDADLHAYFDRKYPDGYNLEDVNRIVYVRDRGYYYIQDILDAYKEKYYDEHTLKWDFTGESEAVVRIYEKDPAVISEINAQFAYVPNHLNSGSPCEYYGVNGLSDGWVATGVKDEYRLSEIFSNHYGNFRVPPLAWGAYIAVETTTPSDVFTVDPFFFTITDSSASVNRSKKVTLTDTSFVASLVLVKRDAQSGQDVKKEGASYRIWDYKNNEYVSKYLLGENGAFTVVAQRIFRTDKDGRINAVASLECGRYRLEELTSPDGLHNRYWDYGNGTDGETLGGVGTDRETGTKDNMFQKYFGAVDFEVTTERRYQSSGITASDNLDYIYIGEPYYNSEIQGKLSISKTGEVLVGYRNTDDIAYADEYTDASDKGFNPSKSMIRDRSVFDSIKDHYDLGTDAIETRPFTFQITVDTVIPVKYYATDKNGMQIAAVYEDTDGNLVTLNGGRVYQEGYYLELEDGKRRFYPGAVYNVLPDSYVYTWDGTVYYLVVKDADGSYHDPSGAAVTEEGILDSLEPAASVVTPDQKVSYAPADALVEIKDTDGILMFVYELSVDSYEGAALCEVKDAYIYHVSGDMVDTDYLVTEKDGRLVTNDHGVLTKKADGTCTLTYLEAVYDPDINYQYTLTLPDGQTVAVKLVTGSVYLTEDLRVVKALAGGGYSIEGTDGQVAEYPEAALSLAEANTGETFDFVYEERRLADATYVIKAAEDIRTQDGGEGNTWFKKGDVVATVTTANDGEIVRFAPAYNKGGLYASTYYYGNSENVYGSLTKSNNYEPKDFSTSGEVENRWVAGKMSPLDLSVFGIPAYTDPVVYPNTFYQEKNQRIYRRFIREGVSDHVLATDYQTRLEAHAGLDSEGCAVLTATPDGFKLTHTETVEYAGAKLEKEGDLYRLNGRGRTGDAVSIEAKESSSLYEVVKCLDASLPWSEGDLVEKTAFGYRIIHTDACETGVNKGSVYDCADDLGYTVTRYYPNASLYDNKDGIWTLYDKDLDGIVMMRSGILVTEAGGIIKETPDGYSVCYSVAETITANQYVTPSLSVKGAELRIKDETYDLRWDGSEQCFKTRLGTKVTFSPDYEVLTVTTGGEAKEYKAFDLLIEYDLTYAQKKEIVTVEKDGTPGMVSVYLPLGSYTVEEVKTPYGFLIDGTVQQVAFTGVDQIKEIVFNSCQDTVDNTQLHMDVWISKGLSWFVGGVNTIGEQLERLLGVDFFTWGTYGDAEDCYFTDAQAFVHYFDQRVKAWSQENPPDKPDKPGDDDKKDRKPESEENQWKLGVGIYKADAGTGKSLKGAKFGLYTKDDILNADGRLIVEKDTLLAVAATDDTGHANFAVDIALMSKNLDKDAADPEIIYHKTITYVYDSFTELGDGQFLLKADGGREIVLYALPDGSFETKTGVACTIDQEAKTIGYRIAVSIDGNTAMNTGAYYIRELTPPDGYLYDDTPYDVEFRYDDAYTMYIPVYAKHKNEGTKVTINKMDLTGSKEIPGAVISVYKVKDVNRKDESGLVSHDAENLLLLDTWTSADSAHRVEGLLLSNVEWPRLSNQEIRENLYVFREEIPAPGYVTAADIEFKLYQVMGEAGWIDPDTQRPYGYEVLVNQVACEQDYRSGLIISPKEHADGLFLEDHGTENPWDYEKVLDADTVVRWLLVNRNLVLSFTEDANKETIDKVLREEDFKELAFDTVYLSFPGEAFEVDFYPGLQVEERPADAIRTYRQRWCTLDDIHISMYDDMTRVTFGKQDLVTGKEVAGATLSLFDAQGNLIDTWVTAVDSTGRIIPHSIEGRLEAGKEYILKETLAPTEDGYVRSNSIRFTVEDDGSIQKVVMQDDFTKLEISKADLTTGEEIDGAMLEIWSVDENGSRTALIERWTTGQDGYDADGRPKRHFMERLPVGNYVLVETMAPEGYLTAEEVYFSVTETGLLQKVQMLDKATQFKVYKYQTGTKKLIKGATIKIYAVPQEYLPYFTDTGANVPAADIKLTEEDLRATVVTDSKPSVVEGLVPGWYVAVETKAPRGYIRDTAPQVFRLMGIEEEQGLIFYNHKKPGGGHEKPEEPDTPPPSPGTPPVGRLILNVNHGWWWNNLRTEDSGEDGSSILLTIEDKDPDTGNTLILLAAVAVGCGVLAVLFVKRRKRN